MKGEAKRLFEFDDFSVDVGERLLSRDGSALTLTSKAFDILLVLVENHGRTVSKDQLMQIVWADTFVEEGNLSQHISTLRRVLEDDPRKQRFIKTIPKLGYRFTGAVRETVDESAGLETVSRSRLVIREETREGFWTATRSLVAAVLIIGVGLLCLWAWSASKAAAGAKRSGVSPHPEAADAYTKGRDLWRNRGAGSLHQATLLLERAVELDPAFALGHAALADAYAFDYANRRKAEVAARRAIELDPNLGEPHASIGFVRMFWEWDLTAAEREFKTAISLSPDYATGHQWYAANLAAMGRSDAALVEIRQAASLDPASVAIQADHCQILYFDERNEEALSECSKVLQRDPGNMSAHLHMYDIYMALGMHDEAVTKFIENRIMAAGEIPVSTRTGLKRSFETQGIAGFLQTQIKDPGQIPYHYSLAKSHMALGNVEAALVALRTSFEKREWDFIFFKAHPAFMRLRHDPRFEELIEKVHAPRMLQ